MKAKVLAGIRDGRLAMRPRWHYISKAVLVLIGTVFALLGLLYVLSLILFLLRQSGLLFVPMLGMVGLRMFLISFPWTLLLLAGGFLVLIEVLLRGHAFVYRKPVVYSIFILTSMSLICGFFVASTPFHRVLSHRFEERRSPIGMEIYRRHANPSPNIHPGIIHSTTTEGFLLQQRDGTMLNIITDRRTHFPDGTMFENETPVVVLGKSEGSTTVLAVGVRIVNDEDFRSGNPLQNYPMINQKK